MRSPLVTSVVFTPAPPLAVAAGLLGWVAINLYDAILINRVHVRRATDGHVCLSFPACTDRWGRKRHTVRPVDDAARRSLETQVLADLSRQGVLP